MQQVDRAFGLPKSSAGDSEGTDTRSDSIPSCKDIPTCSCMLSLTFSMQICVTCGRVPKLNLMAMMMLMRRAKMMAVTQVGPTV